MPMQPDPRPAHEPPDFVIEGLRGLAALMVVAAHYLPHFFGIGSFGYTGVDLFFVLSGFLIGTQVLTPLAQGRRLSLRDFYLRRAFRILPAYAAVLALYLAWPGFREAPGMEPAWKFLAFVVNLSIDYGQRAAFSHAWSLCVEEHFYAAFPMLCLWLVPRVSRRGFGTMCLLIVLAGVALRTAIWLHASAADPGMARNWFVEDLYYPTWNRLDGLLFGVVLAAWKAFDPAAWQRARRHADRVALAGILLMGLAFTLFQDRVGLLGNAVGWPVLSAALALLVFAGAGRDNRLGRIELPLVGGLAAISYSLYLVHKAVYHVVHVQWGGQLEGQGVVAFAVYGLTAVAAGGALHLAVERPFLRWRRRWVGWDSDCTAVHTGTVPPPSTRSTVHHSAIDATTSDAGCTTQRR